MKKTTESNRLFVKKWERPCLLLVMALVLSACAGAPKNPQLASQCDRGLNVAYDELNDAETKGVGGSVSWTKAASLLSAAKVQQHFHKFPNCVDKVKRARYYIKESQSS